VTDLSKIEDFAVISPTEFAQLVKDTPDAKLQAILDGGLRKPILESIFSRMPESFRPDRAASTNAVIHWIVTGGPSGPETYEVRIADGTCETSSDPSAGAPDLAITVTPVDFVKVVSGNGNPVMMFMTGKLKAKGDLGLAANIQHIFAVPKV
jgi:putative sterol carrier protein